MWRNQCRRSADSPSVHQARDPLVANPSTMSAQDSMPARAAGAPRLFSCTLRMSAAMAQPLNRPRSSLAG